MNKYNMNIIVHIKVSVLILSTLTINLQKI